MARAVLSMYGNCCSIGIAILSMYGNYIDDGKARGTITSFNTCKRLTLCLQRPHSSAGATLASLEASTLILEHVLLKDYKWMLL